MNAEQVNTTMRRFVIHRKEDVSGVSGTGIVIEGAEFGDGQVVFRWLSDKPGLTIMPSVKVLMSVHGHEGKCEIVWIDRDPHEAEEEPPKRTTRKKAPTKRNG